MRPLSGGGDRLPSEQREQRRPRLSRVAVPKQRFPNHAAREPILKPARQPLCHTQLRRTRAGRRQRLEDHLAHQRHRRRLLRVRRTPVVAPREHPEDHQPQRPDIGARADRRVDVALLRRHPERRTDGGGRRRRQRLGQELGDPEVQHLDRERRSFPPRLREEHIFGLQIPVHHADLVRRGERVTELRAHLARIVHGQRAVRLDVRREITAVEQLHHQPRRARLLLDPGGDDLHHVVAADARPDPRLLHEASAQLVVAHKVLVHHLQRALAPGAELLDDVDRAHASFAEGAHDAEVRADHGPVLEHPRTRHGSRLPRGRGRESVRTRLRDPAGRE